MTKSLSTPDRYERAVAQYLTTFCNVKANRPTVGPKYPDVCVEYQGIESWIEVKMNEQDRLGNPRVEFDGEKWFSRNPGPTPIFTSNLLNSSDQANEFLHDLRTFMNRSEVVLSSVKEGLNDPAAVLPTDMSKFLSTRSNKYIHQEVDVNVSEIAAKHYNYGKKVPAHYIQLGDQFFRLGNENPFNLDLPELSGNGMFNVRVGERTGKYEIQPDIKIMGSIYSPMSVAPGTMKPHPFNSVQ